MWVHRLSEIDLESKQAVCANCGPVKIHVEYRKTGTAGGKIKTRCWVAYQEKKKRHNSKPEVKEKTRVRTSAANNNIVEPHGLTRREAALFREIIGKCENIGCGSTSRLRVDHDHFTGVIRGVLCNDCNLGRFMEDIGKLRGMAEYLERDRRHLHLTLAHVIDRCAGAK